MNAAPSDLVQVLVRTLRRKIEHLPAEEVADGICTAAAGLVGVASASLCVYYGRGMSVPVGASDEQAALAEQIQFTTGEGPCWQAYRTGSSAVHSRNAWRDAAAEAAEAAEALNASEEKWPAYAEELSRRTGYTDAAALPLRADVELPLVLILYDRADLAAALHGWGQALTTAVPQVLNATAAVSGGHATWLDSSTTRLRALVWVTEEHMMAVARGMDRDAAQEVLRLFAAREMRTVDEIALDVHAGRLPLSRILTAASAAPQAVNG